jgi:hypothetical protein
MVNYVMSIDVSLVIDLFSIPRATFDIELRIGSRTTHHKVVYKNQDVD